MSILYHQIARSQPNMVTEVPISGLYNLPSWNEALYLDNVGYSQNRISDAMTFAANCYASERLGHYRRDESSF